MISMQKTFYKLLWVTLFAIAMAYLEAAVVVYLRMIFYPQGFAFPLVPSSSSAMLIELGREAATIIMLLSVAIICGRGKMERFAYLLFTFGVWDIMYYFWLLVLIGWPPSLLTWDILFLIPAPWVGPVIAPILVSFAMIWAALLIIKRTAREEALNFPRWAWWGEILAGLVIIISFIFDAKNIVMGGLPNPFRWDIFLAGLLGGVLLFFFQMRSPQSQTDRTTA